MPIYELDSRDSFLTPIVIDGVEKAYIMRNPHLEKLLFNRNVIGLDFTKNCELASQDFLMHFESEISPLFDNVSELVILSKGLYYWMHNAYQASFSRNLEANFVVTSRVEVHAESASVQVNYSNFDVPVSNLIIGDTIASGETICATLREYQKARRIDNVFIFSIVGSRVGGQAIAKFCKANNIEATIVYGLAAFGLATNGFDLSFLHPDTITFPEYIELANKIFHGKPVSSAGWDFGTQAQAIKKYRMLCWIEARYWGLEDTDVFLETEPPYEIRLVEKERSAYQAAIPDLARILP
jgi:hypothetical protein